LRFGIMAPATRRQRKHSAIGYRLSAICYKSPVAYEEQWKKFTAKAA